MEKRVKAFIKLGEFIRKFLAGERNTKHQQLDELVDTCYQYNGWFNKENILNALNGIAIILSENDLREFAKQIKLTENRKTVAVIMAGNIPAVGFHDFLCVLLSGNKILIKLSSDDKHLIPFFSDLLIEFEPSFKEQILFTEGKLAKFDAVIATGSSNSARYFDYYFGKYPHIIRKNRTSAAVLTGNETKEELALLGNDIFDYYGLGCRSVSKVFIPQGYKLDTLFEGLFSFGYVIENKKYGNNYEYNRAVYLLNKEPFLDNNFLLIKRSESLHSPVGVLFYEEYTDINDLTIKIDAIKNELQCLVAGSDFPNENIAFGQAQCPDVFTFSDNINTVAFLNNLK
jgi:hypothetical protein